VIAGSAAFVAYTYGLYPAALALVGRFRKRGQEPPAPDDWPPITITVPVYNEEGQIRGLLDSLLALDYPADRRQILIVSDGSTDATDDIVREYGDRGVELLRIESRAGKTAAENAALDHVRGEVVINTDASIRIRPGAVKPLVRRLANPEVGVASGRDISVAAADADANAGESGYVGYEMWVRSLENRVDGIVGASGCFYAIRRELHQLDVPPHLSRDFSSALNARRHGYRAVSVDEALCTVPRTSSLRREYRRKVRTMARGIRTLFYQRDLLNPFRYGWFAWMLASHKVARWLVPLALMAAGVALLVITFGTPWMVPVWGLAGAAVVATAAAWLWPEDRPTPRWLSLPAYLVLGNLAAVHALGKALLERRGDALWEPTRRPTTPPSP
jgi:cellulose synthase/poly-beta-1,6-N-acetylglucosamine synthase-like glycosyltransferase